MEDAPKTSKCCCCIPTLNFGLTLMVLFDLAVGAFWVIVWTDIKEGSSPGYKELETIAGAYGALCACVAVLGFSALAMASAASYSLLSAYFYSIILKAMGSIAACCAVFVLEDEVCYEAKAINFSLGFNVHSSLDCDVVAFIVAAPGALLFLISLYQLVVIASAQRELVGGARDVLIFRKPLLYQYTERNNIPSLSPRNPENAGFYDREAPTQHDPSQTTHNPKTGFLRR